jgi:hypothetical protein
MSYVTLIVYHTERFDDVTDYRLSARFFCILLLVLLGTDVL